MKNSEGLMGALVHRHFATNEIRADRNNPDAEHPFNARLNFLIHLNQAYRRLADEWVQKTTTMQKKSAQAYHSDE